MVTVLLSGGLGNQMFQYAAAKALAKRLDTSFRVDLYALTKKTAATVRPYELDVFPIDVPQVSSLKGQFLVQAWPFVQKHREFFQRYGLLTDTYAIMYQPVFETIKGNITMSGYFQNERYFKRIEQDIRRDFTFCHPLKGKNSELAQMMNNGPSVALHVRRGDYVKTGTSNFITCDKTYYRRAISLIRRRTDNPEFYVFSNDFDWASKNLTFGNRPVTYVDWNEGKDSYLDMQLMSMCRYNIIANSSFSWWAAWLNSNPGKVVVCPGKWFRDEAKNALLKDFYPERWKVLEI